MAPSISQSPAARHVLLDDIRRPRMAKADVNPVDMGAEREARQRVGAALERAIETAALSDKEVAGLCGVDKAEVARWISGERRPHFDRLLRIPRLHWPLVAELAKLGEDIEVVQEIRKKARTA